MVVLPHPDSPTRPKVSPLRMEKRHVGDRLDAADLALEHRARGDRELLDQSRRPAAGRAGPGGLVGPGPLTDEHRLLGPDLGPEDDVAGGHRGRAAAEACASPVPTGWKQRGQVARAAGSPPLEGRLQRPAVVLGEAATRREPAVVHGLGQVGGQPGDAAQAAPTSPGRASGPRPAAPRRSGGAWR